MSTNKNRELRFDNYIELRYLYIIFMAAKMHRCIPNRNANSIISSHPNTKAMLHINLLSNAILISFADNLRPKSLSRLRRPRHRAQRDRRARTRQHAVSSVRLLVHADVVWQAAQQVELRLDPAQDLLVRDEELDISRSPEVADTCAAEVPDETDVGDDEGGYENKDEGCGPGGDLVGADAGTC
jgi:hypothetical protein